MRGHIRQRGKGSWSIVLDLGRVRVSVHREHPFRSIVNADFGIVNTQIGIVNGPFGIVNSRFGIMNS